VEDSSKNSLKTASAVVIKEAVYGIVSAMKGADVVRVQGNFGIGKSATVAKACQYIMGRRESFGIDDVYWLPAPVTGAEGQAELVHEIPRLITLLTQSQDDQVFQAMDYVEGVQNVFSKLAEMRVLLVVDGRRFESEAALKNLATFLDNLVQVTHSKIIYICPDG
jgi:hypothetical protein